MYKYILIWFAILLTALIVNVRVHFNFCRKGRSTHRGSGKISICNGLRLLCGRRIGTMATFTAAINSTRLHSNNARYTIAFGCHNNIPILICKQIVYGLTLADYHVPIMFQGKHIKVCDACHLHSHLLCCPTHYALHHPRCHPR